MTAALRRREPYLPIAADAGDMQRDRNAWAAAVNPPRGKRAKGAEERQPTRLPPHSNVLSRLSRGLCRREDVGHIGDMIGGGPQHEPLDVKALFTDARVVIEEREADGE